MQLQITVGKNIFLANFANNSSANALIDLLKKDKLTIKMNDYGDMEKVGYLPKKLPRNDVAMKTGPGDIILYQGNQLSIYYDKNEWDLTPIAKINNTSKKKLLEALGDGSVTVTFSINNDTDTKTPKIKTIKGGNGNDRLVGTSAAESISGGNGNDTIITGGGKDTVNGGAGNDTITLTYNQGGFGSINGGAGQDKLIFSSKNDKVVFSKTNTLSSYAVNGKTIKNFIIKNIEIFGGGSGNDTLDASKSTQSISLQGNAGNDVLTGGSKADKLDGGTGNDTIKGGAGNDTLLSGGGNDKLYGGSGNDNYKVDAAKGNKVLIDDQSGSEKIELFNVTNIKNINDLTSLTFNLSKDQKTLKISGINKQNNSITIKTDFKSDSLVLYSGKSSGKLLGGNIDLASVVKQIKPGTNANIVFKQSGQTIIADSLSK